MIRLTVMMRLLLKSIKNSPLHNYVGETVTERSSEFTQHNCPVLVRVLLKIAKKFQLHNCPGETVTERCS